MEGGGGVGGREGWNETVATVALEVWMDEGVRGAAGEGASAWVLGEWGCGDGAQLGLVLGVWGGWCWR